MRHTNSSHEVIQSKKLGNSHCHAYKNECFVEAVKQFDCHIIWGTFVIICCT